MSKRKSAFNRKHPRDRRNGRFITKKAYKARLRRHRQKRTRAKAEAKAPVVMKEEVPAPSPVEGLRHYRVQITLIETPYTIVGGEEVPLSAKAVKRVSTVVVEVWARDRADAIRKAGEHLRAKVANHKDAQVREGISALLTLEECVVYGVEEIKEEKPFIKQYVWD